MGEAAADVVVGLVWLVCGGLLWRRRERRRTGFLMAATGATWLAGSAAGPLVLLHRGPLAHVLLAYPGAALVGLGERLVVAGAYLDGAILPVGRDPAATLLLAAAIVGVAAWRFVRETGAVRRSRTAPGVAAALVAAVLAAGAIGRVTGVEFGDYMSWTYDGILVATALMLFADLRTGGWGRAAVADLVIDVGAGGSDTLTRRLAHAVGDPSLAVAYALDDGVTFVDEGGRRVELPGANAIRTVTRFDDGGRTVAAVMHDPAALRDPELLVGARAAFCVAVANVRLQADVRRRVAEVEHSRRRLLSASDEERRRVATELDGNVMPHLDDAARLITFARNGDDDSEVADLESRLSAASAQLRRLTLGLRPAGLEEHGLDHALRELVADTPLAVSLTLPTQRFTGEVEATTWFVCSEALANVFKHAHATTVMIRVASTGDRLTVEVMDDGGGGADPARGSGLRGLAARVEAAGGALSVGSGPGGGTTLVAKLPTSVPAGVTRD